MIHVRTRLAADFTVIANALAQRRGSAVTVGVAAYILSLPDGAAVSIAALCEHFTEGEILISRALNELESAGYLERRRERGPGGRVRTRTYFRDVPVRGLPGPSPRKAPKAPKPPKRKVKAPGPPGSPGPLRSGRRAGVRSDRDGEDGAGVVAGTRDGADAGSAEPSDGEPVAELKTGFKVEREAEREAEFRGEFEAEAADPQAVAVLASLRGRDRRLVLSRPEVDRLAPAVAQWLGQGVGPVEVADLLTTGLPDRLRARPARILAFRLRDLPIAAGPGLPERPAALPWQTCDGGCERAFRAREPGRCRDCPPEGHPAQDLPRPARSKISRSTRGTAEYVRAGRPHDEPERWGHANTTAELRPPAADHPRARRGGVGGLGRLAGLGPAT